MKPNESEPLPKWDPDWRTTIELGFNLDINSLKEGYKTLTGDLAKMANDLNGIIQDMTKNPMAVSQNPKPYAKSVQTVREHFQKIRDRRQSIFNPNGIHPLGFVGSLSNPEILKQVVFLKEFSELMAQDLTPCVQRYEMTYTNVGRLFKICDVFLDPQSCLIASTRGKILLPGEELVKVFEKDGSDNE